MIITYKFLSEQPTKKVLTANGQVIEFSPYYTTQDPEIAEQLRKLYWLRELERTDSNIEAESSTEPLPDSIVRRTPDGRGKFTKPIDENDATTKGYVDTILEQKADKGDYANATHSHEFSEIEDIPYATTDKTGLIRIATDDEQFTENDTLAVSPKTAQALKTMIENIGAAGGTGQMADLKIITETDEYAVRARYITINFLLTGLNKDVELNPTLHMDNLEIVPANNDSFDVRNHIKEGEYLFSSKYMYIGRKVKHYKLSEHIRITNNRMANAFTSLIQLKSVDRIPKSVTDISSAFYGCVALETAPILPDSITNMLHTFNGCSSLMNISNLPDSLTILSYAFGGCVSLVGVPNLPNSVTDMQSTFDGCQRLERIPNLPNNTTNMNSTFKGCTSLVEIPPLPIGVTNINGAFQDCRSLVNAPVLPARLKDTTGAFERCTSLVNAPLLPWGAETPHGMFRNCTSLKRAMLPNYRNTISTSTSSYVFNGCISLKTLVILADADKIQYRTDTTEGMNPNVNIYVKDSQLETYKTTIPNFSATWGSRCKALSELPEEENIWNIDITTGAI